MISVSVVVWVVLAFVAVLLGIVASCFSVRTLRWVSVITALVLTGALTRYGFTHPAHNNSDLVSAFTTGVDRVIQALLQPLWPGHQVPPPGAIGRLVFAFALLLGYRGLEWWGLQRQAPLLDTSMLSEGQPSIEAAGARRESRGALTDGQRHEQLAAELKFRIDAMEIRAPSILPGGSRTNGLASIAEASGVAVAGLAGAIIRIAATLWPSPRRMVLRVWVEPPDTADDSPQTRQKVTAELDEPRTGATIATKTVAGANLNEAASMVAGYVGRQMFAMDRSTPRWCYGAADGSDLSALLLARLERVSVDRAEDVDAAREARIRRLWQAGSASRAAGVVRYELAQLLDLDARDLASLRLHAMDREEYPRFYRSRYRLAMSLEMISNPEHEPFGPDTRERLDEIFMILHRCGATKKTACAEGDVGVSGDGTQRTLSPSLRLDLLNIAARELRDVRRQLTLRRVLWATFWHRDERAVWLPLWWPRHRQAFHDGVCVGQLIVAVRQALAVRECREAGGKPGPGPDIRLRHLWLASRMAAAVAGSCAFVRWIGAESDSALVRWMCARLRAGGGCGPVTGKPADAATRDRVRWLPWLCRTASWQAAYNAACLYAVLAGMPGASESERLDYENRVLVSLERAINNPVSEMERAYDWISRDPDFTVLRKQPVFRRFAEFLRVQLRADYPAPFGESAEPASRADREPVAGDSLAGYAVPRQG